MTLHTRLSLEECKARLAAAVDVERLAFSWSGFGGDKPFLGKFRGDGFRLQKRRYYRNNFSTYFYGRFVREGGTRVEGEFKMHPFSRVFMVIWFSFLAVLFVIGSIPFARGRQDADVSLLVAPIGLAVFGIAMVKFGRWLCRREERAIVALLEDTLEVDGRSGI